MNDAGFDAKLKDALLLAAAAEFAQALARPEAGAEPAWTVAYRFQRKKLLENPDRWYQNRVRPVWKKALRAAACLFLAASLTLGTLMAVSPAVRAAVFHWIRGFSQGEVFYESSAEETDFVTPPAWCPSWLPERWVLTGVSGTESRIRWSYASPEGGSLAFLCTYADDLSLGYAIKNEHMEDALRTVTVQGYSADLYTGGEQALVLWENEDGLLFSMDSVGMGADALLRAAESVRRYEGADRAYTLGWVPSSLSALNASFRAPGCGSQTWYGEHATFRWFYQETDAPLNVPDWAFEPVTVNGWEGRFWAPIRAVRPEVGGKAVMEDGELVGKTITGHQPEESGTLVWTDEDAAATFFLQGIVSREELLSMAEHMTVSALEPPARPADKETATQTPSSDASSASNTGSAPNANGAPNAGSVPNANSAPNANGAPSNAPAPPAISGGSASDDPALSSQQALEKPGEADVSWQLTWIPEGYTRTNRVDVSSAIVERWAGDAGSFTFLYGAGANEDLPAASAEPVSVNDQPGSYWADSGSKSAGAVESALVWSNGAVELRIQGTLDRETLLRMAENVSVEP